MQNKEISWPFFSLPDTICLMESTCQALFPASRRTTLKSFEGIFAKLGCQYRCKWDGMLGIASAAFEVIRSCWRQSKVQRQRKFCVTHICSSSLFKGFGVTREIWNELFIGFLEHSLVRGRFRFTFRNTETCLKTVRKRTLCICLKTVRKKIFRRWCVASYRFVKPCAFQRQIVNAVQEAREGSVKLIRLRMAQNLRALKTSKNTLRILICAWRANSNQVGNLRNAPSVGRV